MRSVVLSNGLLKLTAVPDFGGALATFQRLGRRPTSIFRSATLEGNLSSNVDPNDFALYVLVPWSNRIAGGFEYRGQWHALANNHPDDYPIHGYGWLAPWTVDRHSKTRLDLRHEHHGQVFDYISTLTYMLEGNTLLIDLSVCNLGSQPMPYGLGLHPWLPRDADTSLHANASGVWLETVDHLSGTHTALPNDWDFNSGRPLPTTWTNNAFSGWNGQATICWPARQLELHIQASEIEYFILYTPVSQGVFCFEPVTHPVNAHNLRQPQACPGLRILEPGGHTAIHVSFEVD